MGRRKPSQEKGEDHPTQPRAIADPSTTQFAAAADLLKSLEAPVEPEAPSGRGIEQPRKQQPSLAPHLVLPAPLRFPLLLALNLLLSTALYTLASPLLAPDLAPISRRLDSWAQLAGLAAWRIAELAVPWWTSLDGLDTASLTLLSHFSPLYLLTAFYRIRPATALTSLGIDILATALPFYLLHRGGGGGGGVKRENAPRGRGFTTSNLTTVSGLTALLGAAIYALVVYGASISWLPLHLVLRFEGIVDISAAHEASLPHLFVAFLPLGFAATRFLFVEPGFEHKHSTPRSTEGEAAVDAAGAAGATLAERVWAGVGERGRVVAGRTVVLVLLTGVNAWVQTFGTVQGVESYGALGWAGLWAAAAALTGGAYWWVGSV
ncbi:MAG: hypothetical protein M1829_006012 [Trizodia sp. TS-e1964]|nr:MAG: hypothetical protein M1829_006012 [Trizodia sp. TS-e1964]